jgi:hypothetical protein
MRMHQGSGQKAVHMVEPQLQRGALPEDKKCECEG